MADDDPIGRYGAPCAAITVVCRARLNTAPMGEACLDRRPARHTCRAWLGASERISSAPPSLAPPRRLCAVQVGIVRGVIS
jgi:hypothetical protein